MTTGGRYYNDEERRRWWFMVNDDHGRRGLSAVLLSALLGCGCLQTQTGDGPFKMTAGSTPGKNAAPQDAGVVLAVAKPAPSGPGTDTRADATGPQPAADGPELNPIQPASATNGQEPEQAPPPRPQPPDVASAPPPEAGQPAKDSPGTTPGSTATSPPRPTPRNAPDPAVASKKPASYPPGSAGLVPPVAIDPHQRPVPTAVGGLLNLPPGESPVERAVELSYRLQAVDAERQALERRTRELGAALEVRDLALVQHGRDIHEAAEEVSRARAQVENWRKELDEARVSLKSRQLEDVQTLKAIIALLERLTETGTGPARHDGGAARMPEE
jgi:hypothetical protein